MQCAVCTALSYTKHEDNEMLQTDKSPSSKESHQAQMGRPQPSKPRVPSAETTTHQSQGLAVVGCMLIKAKLCSA